MTAVRLGIPSAGHRPRQVRVGTVSCPSCERAQVDGPGEAGAADLGVSSGNGKGQVFVRGEVVRTVPESRIVDALLDEAMGREWP